MASPLSALDRPFIPSSAEHAAAPTIIPAATPNAVTPTTITPTAVTNLDLDPATKTSHHDLTDIPPDVLIHLFSQLPPGHRLNLRAVSRGWLHWVDHTMVACTHLNLVLDVPEIRRTLLRHQQQQQQKRWKRQRGDCDGAGEGGRAAAAVTNHQGLFETKFPTAVNVRLWVGCQPSATLAGCNGGTGASAGTAAATAMPYQLAVSGPFPAGLLATAAATVQQLSYQLSDAVYGYFAAVVQCLVPQQPPVPAPPPPWWQQRQQAEEGPDLALTWHLHKAPTTEADATAMLLRRYALDNPDDGLQSLSACLPLLGPSTTLKKLSIVTAHDLTLEELHIVRQLYPRLTALALHSHKDASLDFRPAVLPSLEPLFAPSTTTCAGADDSGRRDPPSPPRPPPPPPPPLSTLILSGLRCDWTVWEGGPGELSRLRTLVLHRLCCRMHRLLPVVQELTQLTRLELRGLDYHHSLPLDDTDKRLLREKMEFLSQMQQWRRQRRQLPGDGSGGGNSSTSSGRGGHGDGDDGGVSEPRSDGSEDEDEWEAAHHRKMEVPRHAAAAPWMWLPSAGILDKAMAGCARPDWCGTMRALGRAVRGMGHLRVLVCDVDCPPARRAGRPPPVWAAPGALSSLSPKCPGRDAWALFLAGVSRLQNLQELRLPTLVLNIPTELRRLATALPGLTSLELAALPPLPRPSLPYNAQQARRGADSAKVNTLWRRYVPLASEAAAANAATAATAGAAFHTSTVFARLLVELEHRAARSPLGNDRPQWRVFDLDNEDQDASRASNMDSGFDGIDDEDVNDGGSNNDDDAFNGDSHPWGEVGPERELGLHSFRQLRELILRRGGVRQLVHWLPLPPRLQRLETPIQHSEAWEEMRPFTWNHMNAQDLQLLQSRLLPALRKLPYLGLTLGQISTTTRRRHETTHSTSTIVSSTNSTFIPPARTEIASGTTTHAGTVATTAAAVSADDASESSSHPSGTNVVAAGWGEATATEDSAAAAVAAAAALATLASGEVLVTAMLVAWLPASLASLDLSSWMRPGGMKPGEALACLWFVGEGLPRLKRLGCCLWAETKGPMDPVPPMEAGVVAAAPQQRSHQRRCPRTAVECFNGMPTLEELRVKVFSFVRPHRTRIIRVPLGFLRALQRPLRVVDCSPLDAWCSSDGAVHPRDALRQARAALAAEGCRSLLVSEAEEWATRIMGLTPDMDSSWRTS